MYNILIVDDEQTVSDVLREILSRFGYHAEIAPGGDQGIRMFDTGMFDLVITDVQMPGVDGHHVARHICNSERPFTPIIGISGTPWLLKGDEFDWVIPKPFGLQTLLCAVENVVCQQCLLRKVPTARCYQCNGVACRDSLSAQLNQPLADGTRCAETIRSTCPDPGIETFA